MTELQVPTGTVTFLFTDIEGSTQLWEQAPEAMKAALARHDAIMRQTIQAHHGHVFKTMGDAFYTAFTNALDALSAALAAQRALRTETWGQATIKARMALHTGEAESRDGDYFGPPLNRVARLMAVGHGGQTLISSATDVLVRDHLPEGAELRDMGERRLKDLVRPEHIYQLTASDLETDFPPLKTFETFSSNLPSQLTSFIGREKEIAAIKQLISQHRLVTLTGPGGTGKTRLSLQVAAELLDSFPDGIWFIELAPLADPALIPQTVLTTLSLREESGRSALEVLSSHLREKTVLLILDNCEHLIEAAAQFAESALHICTNLRLLVSSRETLGVAGEVPYRVASLSTPNPQQSQSVETILQYEAIRLFLDRAQTASPTFTISEASAPAMAQICARLDGIPLAIELAAARVKLLKVEQIAERLDDRFRLLTGGSRTALPRQQTLRAMIDWSYDLLSEAEQTLLARLSVFSGGWTLEAAESVCSGQCYPTSTMSVNSSQSSKTDDWSLNTDILDLLTQLVNKSLVVVDADDSVPFGYSTETRYRLLETVRQYARDKLAQTGTGADVRNQHLQYFLGLAERTEPKLTGPDMLAHLDRLDQELDNFRAALEWSLSENVQLGLQLASALMQYWPTHHHMQEGRNWLSELLNQPAASVRNATRAKALAVRGWLTDSNMDPSGIKTPQFVRESVEIYRELGDQHGTAFALWVLGSSLCFRDDSATGVPLVLESLEIYRTLGNAIGIADALATLGMIPSNSDYAEARAYLDEGLELYRSHGWTFGVAYCLSNLGWLASRFGKYAVARHDLTEAVALFRSLGRVDNVSYTISLLGELALREGHYEQACAYFEEALSMLRESGDVNLWLLSHLGYAVLRQGDQARARSLFVEVQHYFQKSGSKIGVVYALEGLASLAVAQAQFEQAVRLFAWADTMREMINDTRPPIEQADVDRDLATIHTHLDQTAFAEAKTSGHAMSMDEAVTLALQSMHD